MQRERYFQLGPGERIDPTTSAVLYSAAWLSDLRVIPDSPPRVYTVRVALSIPPECDDAAHDEAAPLSRIAGEIRVAASSNAQALEQAAHRLLDR